MSFPKKIKIVEVSPRDGFQNEPKIIPTAVKIDFIHQLSETGLSTIETTSFVSPKWIPQLADHTEVLEGITQKKGISYPALVPNLTGLKKALAAGAQEIAVFTAASDTFTQKNINCSIEDSFQRIEQISQEAKKQNINFRGYISCSLGCPYEGKIENKKVADIAERLTKLGCYEISLGDTVGIGTAPEAIHLIDAVTKKVPVTQLAAHFHNTYGQALVNLYAVIEKGISVIDSSVSGLGGCPYAEGAAGNVPTEDVLYMLNGLGIETGIDIDKLMAVGKYISDYLGKSTHRPPNSTLSSSSRTTL